MKNIVIIDTYPSTKLQVEILKNCIENIKPLGYDVLVVSHYPIDIEIQKIVNYYIYDDNNHFLPARFCPHFFMNTGQFHVRVYNGGHALPITRNMFTSINFSKSLGYEFFIFMEFDILFNSSDLLVMDNLSKQMINENKKMIFFKPIDFIECGSNVYETLLFGGLVNFFLEKLQPPIDMEDWLDKKMGYTLELAFFEKFSQFENEYIIIPDHSHNFFKDSKVNMFRYGLFVCELLNNLSNEELPCLFINNFTHNPSEKYVKIYHDDKLFLDRKFGRGDWWFNQFQFDDKEIKIYIYENDENSDDITIKKFKLDKNLLDFYKNVGDIQFQ